MTKKKKKTKKRASKPAVVSAAERLVAAAKRRDVEAALKAATRMSEEVTRLLALAEQPAKRMFIGGMYTPGLSGRRR